MITIDSEIQGKRAYYGEIFRNFEREGFHLCGNWEYHKAFFDSIINTGDDGVTIYLRIPVQVTHGRLDQFQAYLQFGAPFLIKHVVHIGIVEHDTPLSAMDLTGINQFQKPLDPDDYIENSAHWRKAGEQALQRIQAYIH